MFWWIFDPVLWRRSFWFPAAVALLHVLITTVIDLYAIWPDVDRPMHLLGGVAIGYFAYGLLVELRRRGLVRLAPKWLLCFTAVGTVGLATIGWEFYEFCLNHFFGIRVQTSLHDTLLDVFLGMVGGVAYVGARAAFDRGPENLHHV